MSKIAYLVFIIGVSCFSQDLYQTPLMLVNDKAIMADEFVHVYNKNLDVLTEQENTESLEDYLQLFIHFHLKLSEAEQLGIHEEEAFQKEFNKYYKQLADNYIANGEVTDEMIYETYQRLLKEVRVSHLLISVPPNSSNEKWNEALVKTNNLKDRLTDDETSFEELALKFSGDPSVKQNNGDMGWFKVFKMVHPFEDASYKLKVGEVSEPVKTQFGYHLIKKTGERESIGKIKAAHIMLSADNEEQKTQNKEQIYKIYQQLEAGDSFEDLAMHFSDDKKTGEKGGELAPFEVGEINSKIFEDKVFQLQNPGDYTEPFETEFGWHIVKKLGNIPVESFEEMKEGLRRKIKTSNRAQLLNERIKENIISYYNVQIDDEAIDFFTGLLDDRIYKANWKMDKPNIDLSKQILKIEDTIFTYKDFSNYIENQQRGFTGKKPFNSLVNELFDRYIYVNLVEYHKPKLTQLDRDFELKINEYKHGLMIFEVMEREVWEVAKSDTTALENYYNQNKKDYIAPEMINGEVFTFENKKSAKKFLKQVNKKGKTIDQAVNSNAKTIRKKIEEAPVKDLSISPDFELTTGISPYFKKNNKYIVLQIDSIIPQRQLHLDQVRGQVISDYQNLIEEEWIEKLKSKFSVQVKEDALELLKEKFEK